MSWYNKKDNYLKSNIFLIENLKFDDILKILIKDKYKLNLNSLIDIKPNKNLINLYKKNLAKILNVSEDRFYINENNVKSFETNINAYYYLRKKYFPSSSRILLYEDLKNDKPIDLEVHLLFDKNETKMFLFRINHFSELLYSGIRTDTLEYTIMLEFEEFVSKAFRKKLKNK